MVSTWGAWLCLEAIPVQTFFLTCPPRILDETDYEDRGTAPSAAAVATGMLFLHVLEELGSLTDKTLPELRLPAAPKESLAVIH